jgi:hypothetical protein
LSHSLAGKITYQRTTLFRIPPAAQIALKWEKKENRLDPSNGVSMHPSAKSIQNLAVVIVDAFVDGKLMHPANHQ